MKPMTSRVAMAAMACARAALAEPCPVAATPDATPHDLAVIAGPATQDNAGMTAAPGSVFPAISKDGKTIVELFEDHADFSYAPITSLVLWDASGNPTAFRVGTFEQKTPVADVVHQANARLAKTTWRTLPRAEGCSTGDDASRRSTAAFHGVTFTLDPTKGELAIEDTVKDKPRTRTQKVKLAPLGTREKANGGGHCGELTGITSAIWDAASQTVIVVPTGQLGGDSCVGELDATKATFIRLK